MVAISPPSSRWGKQAPLAPGSIPGRCTRVYIRRLDGMLPAWLAQSVERTTLNRVVAGSSPASGALCLFERHAELALCLLFGGTLRLHGIVGYYVRFTRGRSRVRTSMRVHEIPSASPRGPSGRANSTESRTQYAHTITPVRMAERSKAPV